MIENGNEYYLKQFGDNLRGIRKAQGVSQNKLSILADIPLSQVGRIERGEINTTILTVLTLAKALKLEPKNLLDF